VKFSLAVHRKSGTKRATKIFVTKFGGKRYTGIVQHLKDHYGFIYCLEKEEQIFFPLPEVTLEKDQKIEKVWRRAYIYSSKRAQKWNFQLDSTTNKRNLLLHELSFYHKELFRLTYAKICVSLL
jgi:hypothetical protein